MHLTIELRAPDIIASIMYVLTVRSVCSVMYACLSLSRGAVFRRHERVPKSVLPVRAQTVVKSVRLAMTCLSVQMDGVQQRDGAASADADLPFDGKQFRPVLHVICNVWFADSMHAESIH